MTLPPSPKNKTIFMYVWMPQYYCLKSFIASVRKVTYFNTDFSSRSLLNALWVFCVFLHSTLSIWTVEMYTNEYEYPPTHNHFQFGRLTIEVLLFHLFVHIIEYFTSLREREQEGSSMSKECMKRNGSFSGRIAGAQ